MKVHLLEKVIADFIQSQLTSDSEDWYYPHSMVDRFQREWKALSQKGLRETYDDALHSEISNRWWKRDHYRPKEIMLQLIDADPELATIAWKDLQQQNASLDGRLSRFTYYSEQLLEIHRARHFDSIESYHHQDAQIISLYLAGLFPESCSLYPGLETFQRFCKAIGSPDIPKVDDLVRYMKIVFIIFKYLEKNEKFDALLQLRKQPKHKVTCLPFQITYEVVAFSASAFQSSPS